MEDDTQTHPYLSGNFAPIKRTRTLTKCAYTGEIPGELAGGQYVRNGGNPLSDDDLGRDFHWFDGDGMLSGVLFRRARGEREIEPYFVNQYILTDVFLNAKDNRNLRRPLLPSISTLVNGSLLAVIISVARAVFLIILSRLPGSRRPIRKISVANTGVIYHDGRALATCESGPPMRVQLPGLETVGWFNGRVAEGEPRGDGRAGFGGEGPAGFMKEWTTGHPRVDPLTKELISIHSVFVKPYLFYSIVPPSDKNAARRDSPTKPRFDVPVSGLRSPKMMHDFGVAASHTVIMDLPLSLNPANCLTGRPALSFDPTMCSRFGVFPRYEPDRIQWFETNPCVIFHTANCWETISPGERTETCVHLLACRMTSASVLYSAGALATPNAKAAPPGYAEEEQCRLYYYRFPLVEHGSKDRPAIRHQWSLSAIPLEFPALSPRHAMSKARFIYGCSTGSSNYYGAALGKAAKMDYIVKMDVESLIAQGTAHPPTEIKGCVDARTVHEVIRSQDVEDPIKLFRMPAGWYAQESRFIERLGASSEDDGWLLTYVFDESQLDENGDCPEDATSELWVIDAKNMRDVVTKIRLPQRVPYGLHGTWFSEEEIAHQRMTSATRREKDKEDLDTTSTLSRVRDIVEKLIG
ncbi:retinal pigment epithelial membrane protein [Xylariaceae sp. FL0594]|nr:retinal pigment epithelial membrane protein [Xylariaceae sp. FL0594]